MAELVTNLTRISVITTMAYKGKCMLMDLRRHNDLGTAAEEQQFVASTSTPIESISSLAMVSSLRIPIVSTSVVWLG